MGSCGSTAIVTNLKRNENTAVLLLYGEEILVMHMTFAFYNYIAISL